MQNLQDIHDKIFFETKSILETLCKINSKDELLAKQDLFTEVTDRIAFLRILEKNEDSFAAILTGEDPENISGDDYQIIDEATEHVEFNENDFSYDVIEEEVMFTNDLNNLDDEIEIKEKTLSIPSEDPIFEEEEQTDYSSEAELFSESEIPLIIEQEEADYAERIAQKERDFEQMEEKRRTIVEFNKHETLPVDSPEMYPQESDTPLQQAEKKFKLAHIKGLKVVQHLFDNDAVEENHQIEKLKVELGSLLKSNVKTDFMEAQKKKTEFRLDLNDKVAFSKSLFGGNDEELKSTIAKLNSFTNLEDAKNYLSEIYYQKDWTKSDEYAQRLWNLVENKFM